MRSKSFAAYQGPSAVLARRAKGLAKPVPSLSCLLSFGHTFGHTFGHSKGHYKDALHSSSEYIGVRVLPATRFELVTFRV